MRSFIFVLVSGMASIAFQLTVLIWPQKFQSYGPYVRWLWILTGVLFLIWLLSHPSIKKFLGFPGTRQPGVSAPSTVNISPVITVSPNISQTVLSSKQNQIEKIKDKRTPNLRLDSIGWGDICLEEDVWTANPEYGDKIPALIADIVNLPSDLREVVCAESVKALLLVKSRDGNASFSPLPWIDEWYNSADISVGDHKYAVLIVELSRKWHFVVNRRGSTNFRGQSAMEYGLARISHQLSGIGFEGAQSGDCGLTLSQ
jgi:hypothetical protein